MRTAGRPLAAVSWKGVRSMRTAGNAHMRGGRRRPGQWGGWAAARAADVFGGAGAAGGGLNPEVGRRRSERARDWSSAAGSQRGSPGFPVMGPRGACPGAAGRGGERGGRRRAPCPPGLGPRGRWCRRGRPCGGPRSSRAARPGGSPPRGGAGRGALARPGEACEPERVSRPRRPSGHQPGAPKPRAQPRVPAAPSSPNSGRGGALGRPGRPWGAVSSTRPAAPRASGRRDCPRVRGAAGRAGGGPRA